MGKRGGVFAAPGKKVDTFQASTDLPSLSLHMKG